MDRMCVTLENLLLGEQSVTPTLTQSRGKAMAAAGGSWLQGLAGNQAGEELLMGVGVFLRK